MLGVDDFENEMDRNSFYTAEKRLTVSNGNETEDSVTPQEEDEFMSPESILGSQSEEDIVRQLETGRYKYYFIKTGIEVEQLRNQLPEALKPMNLFLGDKAMALFPDSDEDASDLLPAECMSIVTNFSNTNR
jgi:6-phosphogluconate dehydrogenase